MNNATFSMARFIAGASTALVLSVGLYAVSTAVGWTQSPTDPYWTVEDYATAYCQHQSAFYASAAKRGIEIDPTDESMKSYIRDEFDTFLAQTEVTVIGERPEVVICS